MQNGNLFFTDLEARLAGHSGHDERARLQQRLAAASRRVGNMLDKGLPMADYVVCQAAADALSAAREVLLHSAVGSKTDSPSTLPVPAFRSSR